MFLIVGLGNPGKKYENTRHNIGFAILDKFQEKNNFPELKTSKEFNSLISRALAKFDEIKVSSLPSLRSGGKRRSKASSPTRALAKGLRRDEVSSPSQESKIILAKPQTFMNLSGKAVSKIARFYKINPQNIIVIHDDIDLISGKIRIVKNRGAGGHKGVESIIKEMGTKNFIRIRVGICPKIGKPKNIEKFVLQKMKETKPKEKEIVKEIIKKTAGAINLLLKEGLEKAMNKFNR